MITATTALKGLSLGQPTITHNLTVVPLVDEEPRTPSYLMSAEAIAKDLLTITEVSESGSVPNLLVDNRADCPVLLLDGDHLVGCKQNRVLNVSVLLPPGAKTTIPVSCVEHGRWRSESASFDVSNRAMYAELRAARVEQVSRSLSMRRGYACDQGAVWDGIEAKSRRMGSDSHSGAMDGVYSRHARSVDSYLQDLSSAPGQRGAVFAVNGRVVGVELLDAQSSWSACSANVASGYVLDALDHFTELFEPATPDAADAFLERLAKSEESRFDGSGLGENVRFEASLIAGSALTHENRVIHLCAFDLGPSNGSRRRHFTERM